MTTTVDRTWLHRFAQVVRHTTLHNFDIKNTCVFTTRLGLQVLEDVGVPARPQPVFVRAMNEKAVLLGEQQVPISEWPDDAWSVTINGTPIPGGTGWSGHLVLDVRQPGQRRLMIDLTSGQLSRPERGLHVSEVVFIDIESPWTPRDPVGLVVPDLDDPKAVIEYVPMPPGHPAAQGWRESRDWCGHEDEIRRAAGEIAEFLTSGDAPR